MLIREPLLRNLLCKKKWFHLCLNCQKKQPYTKSLTQKARKGIFYPKNVFYGFIYTSRNFCLWGWGAHTRAYSDYSVNEWWSTSWMSFDTSSIEDTSVKNSFTDSSLLQFTHSGKIENNHVTDYQLIKKKWKNYF